jgi:hypothetical protein
VKRLKSLKIGYIIFYLLFFIGCSKTEEGTLKYYIEKNMNMDNISYNIVAEYNEPEYAKSEGQIWKKDDLMLQSVDFSGSEMKILIDNGDESITTYMIEQKSANKRDVEKEELISNDPFGVLYKISDSDLENFKDEGIKELDGEECYLYSGKVTGLESERYSSLGIESLDYNVYFSKSNNVLRKIEMLSDDEIITEISVTSVEIDMVNDKDLDLNIPEDIKIQGE